MKTAEELVAGDVVVAIRDIVEPGLIFKTVHAPKGTPGVVVHHKKAGWFNDAVLLVAFRNGAKVDVPYDAVLGFSVDD